MGAGMGDDFSTAFTLARRELRGGFKGFRIFFFCLLLGVSIIATVGAVTQAFQTGVSSQSRELLGGDLSVRLTHRPATTQEYDFLKSYGDLTLISTLRSMGFADKTGKRTLVSLKAVEDLYPLYGVLTTRPAVPRSELFSKRAGLWGVAVEDTLLTRLGIGVGDEIRLGQTSFDVRAIIEDEPDRVAGGFRYGPRVMLSQDALAETGLVQVGSMIYYSYRIALPETARAVADLAKFKADAAEAHAEAGWRIGDHRSSAPGVRDFIDRVSIFLTLVGLSALIVGGVGVGNAVGNYLEKKKEVVAVLKCLGAESRVIFLTYLLQVLMLALAAIFSGLIIGMVVPYFLGFFLEDLLPIPVTLGFYPQSSGQAFAFGLLVTLIFTVWPIARTRRVSPSSLFRELVSGEGVRPGRYTLGTIALAAGLLVGVAIFGSPFKMFTAIFFASAAVLFFLLIGLAKLISLAARRFGRVRSPDFRMALANLHRPGAPTVAIVLSLGLGLTLLVTVASIDGSLSREINGSLPKDAPAFFFIDIQKSQIDDFDALVAGLDGTSEFHRIPSLRGRITSVKGVPSAQVQAAPDAQWALKGDRGLTYSVDVPEGSKLVAGGWWAEGYDGPPLVSLEQDIALGLGLDVGDEMQINVLGREVTATVSSIRALNWRQLSFNYVIVFDPHTLAPAPHTYMGNLKATPEREEAVYRAVTDGFPNVSVIRVKEALETVNSVLGDLALGVRVTSLVTLVSGVMVLAGAIAAGRRRRLYDTVILKVLGATRGWTLKTFLYEFAALGLAASLSAALLGSLAAYCVLTFAMESTWVFLPRTLAATIFGAMGLTLFFGFMGTYRLLGAKTGPVLRSE